MEEVDTQQKYIFELLKYSICKYTLQPLRCSKEDIISLSKNIQLLITNKNYDYETWFFIFSSYLKIVSNSEIQNLISYVKNHIQS